MMATFLECIAFSKILSEYLTQYVQNSLPGVDGFASLSVCFLPISFSIHFLRVPGETPLPFSSSVNSPSHGYKVRMTSAGMADCGCSYHSHRHESSVESDEGTVTSSSVSEDVSNGRVIVAKEAGEQ